MASRASDSPLEAPLSSTGFSEKRGRKERRNLCKAWLAVLSCGRGHTSLLFLALRTRTSAWSSMEATSGGGIGVRCAQAASILTSINEKLQAAHVADVDKGTLIADVAMLKG